MNQVNLSGAILLIRVRGGNIVRKFNLVILKDYGEIKEQVTEVDKQEQDLVRPAKLGQINLLKSMVSLLQSILMKD